MAERSFSRRLFIAGVSVSGFAFADPSQKSVDRRNASEIGEYAVGFASKASGGGYDHAFVIWYYSDSAKQSSVRRAAGFYPVANDGNKPYDLVLGLTGKVFDDSKTKTSHELTVLVNKEIFERALVVEAQYKTNETYRLGFNDCTTFVQEVAAIIPDLQIPSRLTHVYPSDFIKALYDAN